MDNRSKEAWEGWSIVGAVAVALTLVVTMQAMMAGAPVEGIRGIIRATSGSSFALFALAFTAAAACYFWPNAWTRWQRRNRRYLGVSFALSHFVHMLAIVALGRIAPERLAAETNVVTWIFSGLAALALLILALRLSRARVRQANPASLPRNR
ncbi:hypothetical protein [Steroidobacter cummioxidans]|uniref:hypothetical protein n=1 Tax=Steroidobacter cummioxidans TaxID=1803913 RepID=UPI000E3195D9|nr:hypothetical protein [Steroidobacter cummioxidans]